MQLSTRIAANQSAAFMPTNHGDASMDARRVPAAPIHPDRIPFASSIYTHVHFMLEASMVHQGTALALPGMRPPTCATIAPHAAPPPLRSAGRLRLGPNLPSPLHIFPLVKLPYNGGRQCG